MGIGVGALVGDAVAVVIALTDALVSDETPASAAIVEIDAARSPDCTALRTADWTLNNTSSPWSVVSRLISVVIETADDDSSCSRRRTRRVKSVHAWSLKSFASAPSISSASDSVTTPLSALPYDAHVIGAKVKVNSTVSRGPVGTGVGDGVGIGLTVGRADGEGDGAGDGAGVGTGDGAGVDAMTNVGE